MIKSTTLKFNKNDIKLDNNAIEIKLAESGLIPLRWAIVSVDNETFTVSVAYQAK